MSPTLSFASSARTVLGQSSATEEVSESARSVWETVLDGLPRVGIAACVVLAGWLVGRVVRWIVRRSLARHQTVSFTTVMSKLAGWIVTTVSVLLAVAVTFPSVRPVDLLAGLGFFSVAVGFAFQDILENLLAGLLLLFREPFRAGDQIEVTEVRGVVQRITIRETVLQTYDGVQVLIPNADVYKNAIRIETAGPLRRSVIRVGVAYEADLEEARQVIASALAEVPTIAPEPSPRVLVSELGAATVDLEVYVWADAAQPDLLAARNGAIIAIKRALDEAGIEMPSDIIALQATASLAAALRGEPVTPGGATVS